MKKLIFLLTIVLLSGCYKDKDLFIPDSRPPEMFVKTSFSGIVIDEENQPVSGASVKVGSSELLTDLNGVFFINNKEVNTRKAYIQVEKENYFPTSRTLSVTLNTSQSLVFRLTLKQEIGTFAATAGGAFSLPDGTVFIFPLVPIAGDYDGSVSVSGKTFPIQNDNISRMVPGDLFGINTENEEQALISYGMLTVAMTTDNGQLLDLATDKTINIQLPVSGTLNPPATIPLWYFDTMDGLWHEEGVATLEGGFYRAAVSRVGYWNFAIPFSLMEISGKVIKDSEPMSDMLVGIREESTGTIRLSYTNSEGFYYVKAPANEEVTVGIYDENCEVFTNSITRMTTTTDLIFDDLTGEVEVIAYGGQVIDCDAEAVTNGYVIVGNQVVKKINATGNFNGNFTAGCRDVTAFKAYDQNTQISSSIRDVENNPSLNVNLRACAQMEERISILYDGTEFLLTTNPTATLKPVGSSETGTLTFNNGNGSFAIDFTGDIAGTYAVNGLSMNDLTNNNEYIASDLAITIILDQSVTVGEELTGSFSGSFVDTTGADHSISGDFLVIRDN